MASALGRVKRDSDLWRLSTLRAWGACPCASREGERPREPHEKVRALAPHHLEGRRSVLSAGEGPGGRMSHKALGEAWRAPRRRRRMRLFRRDSAAATLHAASARSRIGLHRLSTLRAWGACPCASREGERPREPHEKDRATGARPAAQMQRSMAWMVFMSHRIVPSFRAQSSMLNIWRLQEATAVSRRSVKQETNSS